MDKSKEPFSMLLDFYLECGGTYEKLADEFKVSVATIERWRNGRSWPEEQIREIIMKRILDFDMKKMERLIVN
jgi:hypothetical protein